MKKNVGYVLENVATFNEDRFSLISFSEDWKLSYDILELSYKLSAKVYWFGEFWRRRDSDKNTIYSATVNVLIPETELNNLPYFQKKSRDEKMEINPKNVINFVMEDDEVLTAIVMRYQDGIGKRLYVDGGDKVIVENDRFSANNELEERFLNKFENSDLENLNGKIKICKIYP